MSDTPRADEVCFPFVSVLIDTPADVYAKFGDTARNLVNMTAQLERELAAERAAREKAEAELKEDVGVIKVWRRRTEEAEAKAARLREALGRIAEGCSFPSDDVQRACRDVARAAMKDTDG